MQSDYKIGYPLVSVIIPCYNREIFISATIESVLKQTWPNIELIVVDDGCTDNSRKIIESYGNSLKLLEHTGRMNRGQSASINLGLLQCCGEFIAILDSDDLFAPEKIEKQVKYLEVHPEIGLVYSNGMAIDENGRDLYSIFNREHVPPSGPEEVLENCLFNVPSNSLVRHSVFAKTGLFDETLRTAQDHDMAIRITEVAKVGYLDECLWYYRRHDGSISNNKAKERWYNGFKILESSCRRYSYPQRTLKRRLAVLNFRLGQCFLEENEYIKAIIHFIKAGILDPARSLNVILGREHVSGPH